MDREPFPGAMEGGAGIIALEGLSGAGKSRLISELGRATGWPVLPEAWVRLSPRPRLDYAGPRALLALERRLLREEGARWTEARRLATERGVVLCDTGFLGPVTYTRALGVIDPAYAGADRPLRLALGEALRRGGWGSADRYVYLDTPPALAFRRAVRSPRAHPLAWRERHAVVGLVERAFWIGDLARPLGERFHLIDGRSNPRRLAAELGRIGRTPTPPAGRGLARALLRALAGPTPRPRSAYLARPSRPLGR